ncbi:MAG TPA: glutamate--tRNA ligase family protein, partial [Methylotenera sp.]|nr:glutamate--tRNA ligase family protein [Methylotenera sp.]
MYVGRFAPSPTGPLHFGSLVAAVASYCDAKVNHGKWLLRIEDLDKPREIAGAADTILRQLEAFGFEWDGEIIYQSQRHAFYTEAFQQLNAQHLLYPC